MKNIEEELNLLEEKLDSKIELTLKEEEKLGLVHLMRHKDLHLLNESFQNYKFRTLLFRYSHDLSFKGRYRKLDYNQSISNIINVTRIKKVNSGVFDEEGAQQIKRELINSNLYIDLPTEEVEKDKIYLEKLVRHWAILMIKENHTDGDLFLMAKETRDTIKKQRLNDYLEGNLLEHEMLDVFIGLVKSKFVFNEAKKQIEDLPFNQRMYEYQFGQRLIHITFESIIHILNRHFGETLSIIGFATSKSFHNPDIDPLCLDRTFKVIISLLHKNESLIRLLEDDNQFLLELKKIKYVFYLAKEKMGDKMIVKTFYRIDEAKEVSNNEIAKYLNRMPIDIGEDWRIYIKKSS